MDFYEVTLERAARQQLRLRARRLRGLVNPRRGALRTAGADAVDIPPVRHRHAAAYHRQPAPMSYGRWWSED
ncbi:hypothetical protein [Streptomyces sp. NPDC051211]|uniref:hypothetical protein n=1 Tax=Streptomyces sp. NPDC051211 TaxID=3154643 RepID=UPI00344F28A1